MNQKKGHLYIHGCNGDVRLNERRLKYFLTKSYIVQHHQLLSQSLRRKKKPKKAKTN